MDAIVLSPSQIKMKCPICAGSTFYDFRGRLNSRCSTCHSVERTRVAKLFIDKIVKLKPGARILHFAPEPGLSKFFQSLSLSAYEPCDLDPERYDIGMPIRKFDLCSDLGSLKESHYDLIVHNHVLEHLPCNYAVVLQKLQQAVKPGGYQLFSIPMQVGGYYREDLDRKLSSKERAEKFKQFDHFRMFGSLDFDRTVGMVLGIDKDYDLRDYFSENDLLAANIPKRWWRLCGASVFPVKRI
ncbi:methyltransferase domain-containing protein [Kumtagia ephedrae]|uniref:methyltransferase domain-containing protein n=1 Tax=Kumtagia ephedrae TaxID=2116701 RepID=UPI001402A03A|nr:methyltransferase domain-containing protein [Mesorhizobium ephedrae]